MEKSRRVRSCQNQYKTIPTRLNQPRKSLSTSDIFLGKRSEILFKMKPQFSEPSPQPNSDRHEEDCSANFCSFDQGITSSRRCFEERNVVLLDGNPKSPVLLDGMAKSPHVENGLGKSPYMELNISPNIPANV